MAGTRVAIAVVGRRRSVQHRVGKAHQTTQGVGTIQVADQLHDPGTAQTLVPLAHQGQHPISLQQAGQGTAGDVATTNDQ